MPERKIIEIDEDKCNGCGECIPACDEGALQIVDGVAQLVDDKYCDGLGDCLGECPQDAIQMIEREAAEFDEEAVEQKLKEEDHGHSGPAPGGGCPGAAAMDFSGPDSQEAAAATGEAGESALKQWPVQLHLVPSTAPYLENADLLLSADCVPFALANFHNELLSGRRLLIGCPKLDDGQSYREKLGAILENNSINSLTVAHMEVPCCYGLIELARKAIEESGSDVELKTIEIGVEGDFTEDVGGLPA